MKDNDPVIAGNHTYSYFSGLVVCVFLGLVFALLYSALAILIWMISGSTPFTENGTTLALALSGYLIGFATLGFTAGLLNPLGRTQAGAGVLGALSGGVAMMVVSRITTGRFVSLDYDQAIAAGGVAVTLGCCVGVVIWDQFVKHDSTRISRTHRRRLGGSSRQDASLPQVPPGRFSPAHSNKRLKLTRRVRNSCNAIPRWRRAA